MSHSNHTSGIAVVNAADRAKQMRDADMGAIHPGTVAFLLAERVAKVNLKYGCISRILTTRFTIWSALAVTEAHRLNGLPESELRKLDPKPPVQTELPENLRSIAGFGEFIKDKTQSAPS